MVIESGTLLPISLLAILFQYLIIRYAVSHGTSSTYKDRQLYIQTRLLAEIARRSGVSEEEINSIYNFK